MISSFPEKKSYNPGGYTSFYFVPADFIQSFPLKTNGTVLVPVGFWGDNTWLKGYATPETLLFEEECLNNGNGPYYTPTITGFVPGEDAALADLLERMEKVRHVVVLRDAAGRWRLVGTPIMPLDFIAKYSSGSTRADQKGFTFKFSGESIRRAPAYLPINPVV